MGASLSGVFSLQELTDLGLLAAGYRLYTYAPATTTLKVAYTDQAGLVPHTYTADGLGGQYIALNARGELPAPLFLTAGGYDITLKTPAGVTIWTRRAIGGSDDANSLRADLANSTDPAKGAALVAFDFSLAYPVGSIGEYLKHGGSTGLPFKRLKADYGAVGDGIADDTAAYVAALAAIPEGASLVYDGYFRITSTVTVSKRLMHLCFSAEQGVIVDVGTSNDGLVFLGSDPVLQWGLNGMEVNLNVYGKANSCRHAVVMSRADRSVIKLNIRAGATAYGLRARGCLINTWDIDSTTNFAPPASLPITPGMQANHMVSDNYGVPTSGFTVVAVSGAASPAVVTWAAHGFSADQPLVFSESATAPPSPFTPGKPYFVRPVDANHFQLSEIRGGTSINSTTAGTSPSMATCAAIAPNDNDYHVNFEGGGAGFVQSAVPGEGSNTLRGQIEGITGAPFFVEDSLGFTVTDLKMEANGIGSTIKNSQAFKIGMGVIYLGDASHPSTISIQGCSGYSIDGYYGSLNIDSASVAGSIGAVSSPDLNTNTISDVSCVQTEPLRNSTTTTVFQGAGGLSQENIFNNCFTDLYAYNVNPAVGPPLGFTPTGAGTMVRETGTVYYGNEQAVSIKGTSSATGAVTNGGSFRSSSFQAMPFDQWISILVPCGHNSTNAVTNLTLYLNGGATVIPLSKSSASDVLPVWKEHRASFKVPAGQTWDVYIGVVNQGTQAAAAGFNYFIGGVHITRGAIPPKNLGYSYKRAYSGAVVTAGAAPSFAPAFTGQVYVDQFNSKVYIAKGTSGAGDWLLMN